MARKGYKQWRWQGEAEIVKESGNIYLTAPFSGGFFNSPFSKGYVVWDGDEDLAEFKGVTHALWFFRYLISKRK